MATNLLCYSIAQFAFEKRQHMPVVRSSPLSAVASGRRLSPKSNQSAPTHQDGIDSKRDVQIAGKEAML